VGFIGVAFVGLRVRILVETGHDRIERKEGALSKKTCHPEPPQDGEGSASSESGFVPYLAFSRRRSFAVLRRLWMTNCFFRVKARFASSAILDDKLFSFRVNVTLG
jgi:hypothetical protein